MTSWPELLAVFKQLSPHSLASRSDACLMNALLDCLADMQDVEESECVSVSAVGAKRMRHVHHRCSGAHVASRQFDVHNAQSHPRCPGRP